MPEKPKPGSLPAFPLTMIDREGRPVWTNGMTIRDYFAAAALTGLLADPNCTGEVQSVSKAAYQIADAMVARMDRS